MNRDDIIRMAREAGIPIDVQHPGWLLPHLERFAALVAAENDKKWEKIIAKIDEYASVCNEGIKLSGDLSLAAIDTAVAAEREACARVCEEIEMQGHALWDKTADPDAQGRATGAMDCAKAIRARGEECPSSTE